MKRALAIVGFAIMVGLPSLARAQSTCVQPADVCAFFNSFLTALNKRDWPAYRVTLADSISVFLEDPAPAQRFDGRAAAESLFIQIFPPPGTPSASLPAPIVPRHLRIQSFGDVAIISFEIVRPQAVARRTLIARRGADGWQMVHIHGSARTLPPPGI